MQKVFALFICGTPLPQPRPRARVIYTKGQVMGGRYVPGRPMASVYEGDNGDRKDGLSIKGWKETLSLAMNPYVPPEPFKGPMRLDCSFYFARPTYMVTDSKYRDGIIFHDKQGDYDNLAKVIADVMQTKKERKWTTPGFFDNDGQVSVGLICKYYVARNPFHPYGQPGVHVRLYQLSEADLPEDKNLFTETAKNA